MRRILPPRAEAPRTGAKDIHESLFRDANVKRRVQLLREAERDEEINEKAHMWTARQLSTPSFDRLCYAQLQKDRGMQELRGYLTHHEDPASGRPLHTPRITRGPKRDGTDPTSGRKGGGGTASALMAGDSSLISGEAFHSHRVKLRKSREALQAQAAEQISREHQMPTMGAFTTGASDAIVEAMRDRRITELFHGIDVTGEGVIDDKALLAALPSLPNEISSALRPLLQASPEQREFRSLSDFKALITRALEQTAPNGPRYMHLLGPGQQRMRSSRYLAEKDQKMREQQAECSFSPRVDARSAKVAARSRDPSKDVVEKLIDCKAEYDARQLSAQRAAKARAEAECTFRPVLVAKPRGGGSRFTPRRLTQSATSKQSILSSEELELQQHCTFKPRVNEFEGVAARVDTDDPLKYQYSHEHESAPAAAGAEIVPSAEVALAQSWMADMKLAAGGDDLAATKKTAAVCVPRSVRKGRAAAGGGGAPPPSLPSTSASAIHSSWGVYRMSGEPHSSFMEQDLARSLQLEIEHKIAQLQRSDSYEAVPIA